ncbi:DUF4326 domain-containing protein [Rhizobium sp. PAMB 3174]
MTAPVRLRLSRARGFDLQALSIATNGLPAVNVARPSAFGNPFIVGKDGDRAYCVTLFSYMLQGGFPLGKTVSVHEQAKICNVIADRLDELRGRNLACWCPKDGNPCHADVLIAFANRPRCDEVKP